MQHQEDYFNGPVGKNYFQHWRPSEPPKALILIAHGAAEHSGRYVHVAEYFVEQGYAVAALDHMGNGRSDGDRMYVERFDDFLTAMDQFITLAGDLYPGIPKVLVGHSMGGLISLNYLINNKQKLDGCILSGPGIKLEIPISWYQKLIIDWVSLLFPKLGVLQLDAEGVSRDPVEVEKYINDPLNYTGKLPARTIKNLLAAVDRVWLNAANITLPMLMLHGEADAMASAEGSVLLDKEIGSTNKKLIVYPELYHEIFNEPEKEQVFADMSQWLDELLAA